MCTFIYAPEQEQGVLVTLWNQPELGHSIVFGALCPEDPSIEKVFVLPGIGFTALLAWGQRIMNTFGQEDGFCLATAVELEIMRNGIAHAKHPKL